MATVCPELADAGLNHVDETHVDELSIAWRRTRIDGKGIEVSQVIRGSGRASILVGWVLIALGAAAVVVFVILSFTIAPWMLVFLFGPLMLFAGGGINLWMGFRSRLEIRPDRFIWGGSIGSTRVIAWRDVREILLPPLGSRPRLAAIARLRDGRCVEIEALWMSRTSPALALGGAPDHSRAQQALIDGHRTYLAAVPTPPVPPAPGAERPLS